MAIFQIITTDQVVEQLKVLTDTGLYGSNYGEAAERLITRELGRLFPPDLVTLKKNLKRRQASADEKARVRKIHSIGKRRAQ